MKSNYPKNICGETPLQEVNRMKLIESHFKKLSKPSRDLIIYVQNKRDKELSSQGK